MAVVSYGSGPGYDLAVPVLHTHVLEIRVWHTLFSRLNHPVLNERAH